jgi:hypothetical protein
MLLPLGATAIVATVLLWELSRTRVLGLLARARTEILRRRAQARRLRSSTQLEHDPGRERRAERRARTLLCSCVNEDEWAMYRDLGFLRVWSADEPQAYLIYPHRPIVVYLPQTGALLGEYCVAFPDHSRPYGSTRLPDADDVLAKWMALTADERRLVGEANMHLPGRQVDAGLVRADLTRLARWERERLGRDVRGLGSVRAA